MLELLREWDDDNGETTDRKEFRMVVQGLDVKVKRKHADEVFDWLLIEAAASAEDGGGSAREEIQHWVSMPMLGGCEP